MFFDSNYEVFLADTSHSKNIHYKIRYQVYCQETGFENPENYVTPLEVDEYDAKSIHFVAKDKASGDWLGAIRLVVGVAESTPSFNSLSDESLDKRRILNSVNKFQSNKVVEISRLCVLKKYRTKVKNKAAQKVGSSDIANECGTVIEHVDRKRQSEIMMGLVRAAYAYCVKNKLDVCLFTVTKALARILSSLGFNIKNAGQECEYHGIRAPYFCEIENFLSGVDDARPDLYQMFKKAVAYRSYSYVHSAIGPKSLNAISDSPSLKKIAC